MSLSANREVDRFVDQELRTVEVAGSTVIYKGALVGIKSDGYARGLVAGDKFAGVAYEQKNNALGSDADLTVRVYTIGDFPMTLSGAAIASLGRPVFASADDTLNFIGFGNSHVGVMVGLHAANTPIVRIDPARRLVKTITHAVEDLAANADITARAIHSHDSEGWITAVRVVSQGTAAGIDDSNTCVVTVAIDAGTVATETFDSTTAFPAENTVHDFGAPGNAHAYAGDVVTVAVTNGTAANPPAFLVEVDYV